jgi:hypothetical protein
MTRDDIIKMTREAGFNPVSYMGANLESFERFAALVAAAEREACAKLCEELLPGNGSRTAAAIRARGKQCG